MEREKAHIQDLAEIRTMMERSSKFLSLSGWAGVMAGIYALAGAWVVYSVFHFNPSELMDTDHQPGRVSGNMLNVILVAALVLILAVGTAILYSYKKALKRGEKIWNGTSRRVLENMCIPLIAGGILILILFVKNVIGLIPPMMLLFYGLALYTTSKYTYSEIKYLGLIQILLGLISSFFIEYSLLLWAIGFGIFHIVYGIYIHYKYEQ